MVNVIFFLEDDRNRDDKEREADAFATSQLIPEPQWRRFVSASHFSESRVQALADDVGIPAGTVVGRLQHESMISFSRFNHLKKRV